MSGVCTGRSFFDSSSRDNSSSNSCSSRNTCVSSRDCSVPTRSSGSCRSGDTCISSLSKKDCTVQCTNQRNAAIRRCNVTHALLDDQHSTCLHKALDQHRDCKEWCEVVTRDPGNVPNSSQQSIDYSTYSGDRFMISPGKIDDYISENFK